VAAEKRSANPAVSNARSVCCLGHRSFYIFGRVRKFASGNELHSCSSVVVFYIWWSTHLAAAILVNKGCTFNNIIQVATLHYLLEYVDLLLSLLQLVRKSRRLCCLLLQLLDVWHQSEQRQHLQEIMQVATRQHLPQGDNLLTSLLKLDRKLEPLPTSLRLL